MSKGSDAKKDAHRNSNCIITEHAEQDCVLPGIEPKRLS